MAKDFRKMKMPPAKGPAVEEEIELDFPEGEMDMEEPESEPMDMEEQPPADDVDMWIKELEKRGYTVSKKEAEDMNDDEVATPVQVSGAY